jgi:hypothetical protein
MRFDGINMKGYFKPQEVDDLPLPDPDEERRVVYNKSDKRIYYNDGQNWIQLGESEDYQLEVHGDEKHAETYIKKIDNLTLKINESDQLYVDEIDGGIY